MNDTLDLSVFSSARDASPLHARVYWRDLVELLREESGIAAHRSNKLAVGAMVLGRFDGVRANANVVSISGIACDIDIAPLDRGYLTFDAMRARLVELGVCFILYTTTKSRASHHRLRVVLRYGCDIGPSRHLSAWQAVNDRFGGTLDAGTKDAARISFVPRAWTGDYQDQRTGERTVIDDGHAEFAWGEGEPILTEADLDALPEVSRGPAVVAKRTVRKPVKPVVDVATGDDHLRVILNDLDRCPYVSPRLRETIAGEPGQRVFRFMCAVARNAERRGYPIDAGVLADLARAFERSDLFREPAEDLDRQAKNVLAQDLR